MTAGATRDPAAVGPYRLVRRLGEGGMGVVHLAADPAGRTVALKVLRAQVANDDEARRRLAREVSTLRRVRHPRVAEVLDADVMGAEPYLVTRFVPGRSLEDEVRLNGPLRAGQVARLGRTLAGALGAIHAAGVVHRDVKPANVMIVDDEPVLIDFGIAHVVDESRITRTGLVMGTPGYLSPELIYGGPVTPATDWWAWGATLVFVATGRQPFGSGPIPLVLERVRRGQSDLDGIESGLRELLAATLTVDARQRPTAAELMAGLDDVIAGVTTSPSAVEPPARHTSAPDDLTARAVPPRPVRAAPLGETASLGETTVTPPLGATQPLSPAPPVPPRSVPPEPQQPPGWAPQYGNPQHGSPQHGNPQYGNPQYGSPQYGSPQHGAFSYGTPQAGAPYGLPPVYAPHPQGQPAPFGPPQGQDYRPGYQQGGYPQPPPAPYPWALPPDAQGSQGSQDTVGQGPAPSGAPDSAAQVTGSLAAIALALAAIGSVAPGSAIVLAFCLSVLARLVQRSSSGLRRRREELGGRRPTDVVVTVAALPWRLLRSVMVSAVTFVLPVLVGASTSFIAGSIVAGKIGVPPISPLVLSCGMLAGSLTAWWGLGGRSLRMGGRTVVRAVTGGRTGQIVLVSACALLLLAAWMVARQSGGTPDWTPFPSPSLEWVPDEFPFPFDVDLRAWW